MILFPLQSISNIFMLNVSKYYSRLSKEERINEIDNSMKSKFLAKTLYSVLHTTFSVKINKNLDKLDKDYAKAKLIELSADENAYFTYAYAYYGSIIDSITNSLMPLYAKKPITQLRYGKTFIFANYFGFAAQIYGILNLNNMKMLFEHQAIASANSYSIEKMSQYLAKKYVSIVVYFGVLRGYDVSTYPSELTFLSNVLFKSTFFHVSMYFTMHIGTLLWLESGRVLPRPIYNELQDQTSDMFIQEPPEKGPLHSFGKDFVFGMVTAFTFLFSVYTIFRWYAFYTNVVYFFIMPVRLFSSYHRPFQNKFSTVTIDIMKSITADPILKLMNKILRSMKSRNEYNEIMNARLNDTNFKRFIEGKRSSAIMPSMTQMMDLDRMTYTLYKDDNVFFDGVSKEEEFLNQRSII